MVTNQRWSQPITAAPDKQTYAVARSQGYRKTITIRDALITADSYVFVINTHDTLGITTEINLRTTLAPCNTNQTCIATITTFTNQ